MSLERAKSFLEAKGFSDRIILTEHSSATVAEAAEAVGCEPGMIAKTLSFLQGEQPVLILAEGTARGGVCPFGVKEGVRIYLDEKLKLHETVYPACGNDHSAVRLTTLELEQICSPSEWIDVCKM